ncbi:MAG: GAF domain-containing protein [Clostridiales bacterium]|jgi:PAS domain-containing protein|nr:GAF domain-containing protein [Clostridiales bacterium]
MPIDENRVDFLEIFQSITSNIELELLMGNLVPRLMEYTGSQCGAFYIANNGTMKLEVRFTAGLSKAAYTEFDINIGEGLLGFAATKKDLTVLTDIPDDTVFTIKTFLGDIKPRSILFVPVIFQDQLMGLLAFSSVHPYERRRLDLISQSKYFIGSAVSNSVEYERTKRLSDVLNFQNKLIADLNRDLENKLEERTNLINLALDGINDCAVFALDPAGQIILWNRAAERVFGVSARDAMGHDGIMMLGRGSDARAALYRFRIDYAHKHGVFTESGLRTDSIGSLYDADITYASMTAPSKEAALVYTNRIHEVI